MAIISKSTMKASTSTAAARAAPVVFEVGGNSVPRPCPPALRSRLAQTCRRRPAAEAEQMSVLRAAAAADQQAAASCKKATREAFRAKVEMTAVYKHFLAEYLADSICYKAEMASQRRAMAVEDTRLKAELANEAVVNACVRRTNKARKLKSKIVRSAEVATERSAAALKSRATRAVLMRHKYYSPAQKQQPSKDAAPAEERHAAAVEAVRAKAKAVIARHQLTTTRRKSAQFEAQAALQSDIARRQTLADRFRTELRACDAHLHHVRINNRQARVVAHQLAVELGRIMDQQKLQLKQDVAAAHRQCHLQLRAVGAAASTSPRRATAPSCVV